MLKIHELDTLMYLGGFIKEVYFNRIPPATILEALKENDMSTDIIFHLPLNLVTNTEYFVNSTANKNIHSANFQTDLFIEAQDLYCFPNLRNLALTCDNHEAIYISEDDMRNMLYAVMNLNYLELLILNISEMKDEVIEYISKVMQNSFYNLEVLIE